MSNQLTLTIENPAHRFIYQVPYTNRSKALDIAGSLVSAINTEQQLPYKLIASSNGSRLVLQWPMAQGDPTLEFSFKFDSTDETPSARFSIKKVVKKDILNKITYKISKV